MKTINKNDSYKWGSLNIVPKHFKKCDHSWRELTEYEKGGSVASHECVLCGLEKDTSWEPAMYGYQLQLIEVCEGVTLDDIEMS